MLRRNDSNAVRLLEIITDEVLQCEQVSFFSMSDENIRVKNSLQEKEYKVSVVVLPSLKIFKI